MPYDATQAARVRKALAGRRELTEKEMFGGIAFLLRGNMCVGLHGDELIVRVAPDETDALPREAGAKVFDLSGGRPMRGWLLVEPKAYRTDSSLKAWVARAVDHAGSLPGKSAGKKR
jgi:TfoX/Sxy family transcriptional regulator of competence genes